VYVGRKVIVKRLKTKKFAKEGDINKMRKRISRLEKQKTNLKTKLEQKGEIIEDVDLKIDKKPTIILCSACNCPLDVGVKNCPYCGASTKST